ncbi:GTP-binding protein [Cellulosilyticum sp. I15G10I2]|uniref:GTP-binding protein n=1 Tax=Cellulosilyticum sp. I15G10I2 TaxID=1892843 RepID=UPI00085CBD6D|nr:GTP-binding protein [Cellulosilyticum sp. I15G10I2]
MFKTQVELITGFIGAGKTTWINHLLKLTAVPDEKIIVLQLEKGQEVLDSVFKQQEGIVYLTEVGEILTLSYLKNLLVLYEPDRLIIECNGMKMIDEIIALLSSADIKKRAVISTLFNLAEAPQFMLYWQNLKPILQPALSLSHMIIVTKTHLMKLGEEKALFQLLEEENKTAHIVFVRDQVHMEKVVRESSLLDKGWPKAMRITAVKHIKKILAACKGGSV